MEIAHRGQGGFDNTLRIKGCLRSGFGTEDRPKAGGKIAFRAAPAHRDEPHGLEDLQKRAPLRVSDRGRHNRATCFFQAGVMPRI
jgi:hypothetical protein